MSKNAADQKYPSVTAVQDVSGPKAPMPGVNPRQTLDPRPSFNVNTGGQPSFPIDSDDTIDYAGNTGGNGVVS